MAVLMWMTVLVSSCTPVEKELLLDDLVYGIDTVPVYATAAEKTRLKSESQFLGTAYANLYLRELVLEKFLNDPDVQATMPSDSEMRADLEAFVQATYLRFFQRLPGAYESVAIQRQIENDPELSPTDVFRAFINSNEYLYY
jgi:hypothetical protein